MKHSNRNTRRAAVTAIVGFALAAATAGQAAPTQADTGERAAGPRDKVVCKRFVRTGTLADTYRTCKQKWEWERERENLRQLNVANSCRALAEGGTC